VLNKFFFPVVNTHALVAKI